MSGFLRTNGLEVDSTSANTDIALVNEFVSGRANAFDRLYDRHSSYVYNICLGIVGNPDDARDAMQETFIQLYRSLTKFRGQSRFSTWLYRIAVNKCMDSLRNRSRCESSDSLEWVRHPDLSPADTLQEEHVRQTILKLKPNHRTVLVLYYFQQLSYAEIAEVTECSVDQVRIRLHRARKEFRALYDDGGSVDEV